MAESSAPSSAVVAHRRPSSAGDLDFAAVRQRSNSCQFLGNAEGPTTTQTNNAERERPLTAPSGGLKRAIESRPRRQAPPAPPPSAAAGNGDPTGVQGKTQRRQPRRERGVSARAVEARLDELRADEDVRAEFFTRVDGIIERRGLYGHGGLAWGRKARRSSPKTRKVVRRELRRAHPLDTERKADLVELLRSGGLEANRATQTLLDAETKAVLTRRANEWRRAREARIRDLVSARRKHERNQQLAERENQAFKHQQIRARRERARQARGQVAQTKGWLTALKMHTAIVWVANGVAGIADEKKKSEAAKIITRHVITVARYRFKLRVEAATRVIDNQFAKKIRRWKTKRDGQATAVLERFLTDVRSSNVRTKVKLLAYRVAHAHVQLARLQRWWRRRRQEMAACRSVMCRLWEQEVDRRVDAKVDEIWRARNEAASLAHENSNHYHHHNHIHHQTDGGGGALGSGSTSGTFRWGIVRNNPSSCPGGGGSGGGPLKEVGHGAATAKGKSARQARGEQARGERAAIRYHLLLDPLINPPADLKVRMCREYLKQMARRHAGAVGEFHEEARRVADTQIMAIKFGEKKRSLLAVSLAVQARRQAMHAKGIEVAVLPTRPRWRTGALPGEVPALVDAGIDYILGMRWLWEPQTPSRLDDGTLVADSMPTPEELARRVASKFRYGGKKLAMLFQDECSPPPGIKGITAMTRKSRLGGPESSGLPKSAAQSGYAPGAAGWIGEAAAATGSIAGGKKSKKRVAPLLTYHYLPPSSSCNSTHADKKL